jgi:hypothetical protein
MVGHRLGAFYEGFSSWRRALARTSPESQLVVFANACAEGADFISKGCDRIAAIDELSDLALSIGYDNPDQVQKIISDALALREEPRETAVDWDQLPDEEPGALLESLAADGPSLLDREPIQLEEHRQRRRGNGAARPTSAPSPVLMETGEHFTADFEVPEYLIDGVLARGFLYSFTGRTGAGKTAITLYIAACVALDRAIGDLEVTPGRVLYLCGENPVDVQMRWIAMAEQLDFSIEDTPVIFMRGRFDIAAEVERIKTQAMAIGDFALVVVDTSAAYFFGEDINSNVQQAEHARVLRQLIGLPGRPGVLVLCHPVKNAAADNLVPLGAQSFLSEVDGNLTCAEKDGAVEVSWQGKIRGADFPAFNFKLDCVTHQRFRTPTGKMQRTVIARPLSEAAQDDLDKAARGNAQLLLEQIAGHPNLSQREYGRMLGWIAKTGKPHTGKISRVITKLKTAKLLTVEMDHLEVTPKGKKWLGQSGTPDAEKIARPKGNRDINETERDMQ